MSFEVIKYSQHLRDALLPEAWDPELELEYVLNRGFRLSPKDHWENNGVLENLFLWSKTSQRPLLWIGGSSGNQDPWVSELSADLVQALQPQLLTLLYVFCGDTTKGTLTSIRLVKQLITQILALQPELAYSDPEVLSLSRFQRAVTFGQVWRIFEQLALQISDLFLIIDRIEECGTDEQADLKKTLLPSLLKFVGRSETARVIITSVYGPPTEVLDSPFLQNVYIDTSEHSHSEVVK